MYQKLPVGHIRLVIFIVLLAFYRISIFTWPALAVESGTDQLDIATTAEHAFF